MRKDGDMDAKENGGRLSSTALETMQGPYRRSSPVLFRPSIYSYTCYGYFAVSNHAESNGKQQNPKTGKCYGYRSMMRLLVDEQEDESEGLFRLQSNESLRTRTEAIREFVHNTGLEEHEDDEPDRSSYSRIFESSTAIIFGNNDEVGDQKKSKQLLNNDQLPLGKEETWKTENVLPSKDDKNFLLLPLLGDDDSWKASPENVISVLSRPQSFRGWGATEVEYLVLENDLLGVEDIAAISPQNQAGVSARKLHYESASNVKLSLYSLSFLQFRIDLSSSTTDMLDQSETESESSSLSPQKILSALSENSATLSGLAYRIGSEMKRNATWVRENVSDDFGTRMVTAMSAIVQRVPETVERTTSFMAKLIKRWME